jgi:hypothetical protein
MNPILDSKEACIEKRLLTSLDFSYYSTKEHKWEAFGGGGNLYGHLITQRFFTLTMNGVFMQTPKIMKNLATLQIEFANRLALIVCLISMK